MGLPRFTLRQLDAFVAVAELLSFKAAGERLALTPSAVSQLVGELESLLAFRLFERHTRQVALLPAGQEFLGSARAVLEQMRRAALAADDVRQRAAGVVRVAAPPVIAALLLPPALADYRRQRPKVVVRLVDTPVEWLVDRVASGEADLAVGPGRTCGEAVQRELLFDSPWVLWCRPDHPLAARRTVRWSALRGVPLVAAGRDHEHHVERMRPGLPESERIAPVEVVDQISTALGLAAAGLAAAVSPAYVGVLAERLGLVMRRIVAPEAVRPVCLYRSTHRASPAAEGLADHLGVQLKGGPFGA